MVTGTGAPMSEHDKEVGLKENVVKGVQNTLLLSRSAKVGEYVPAASKFLDKVA